MPVVYLKLKLSLKVLLITYALATALSIIVILLTCQIDQIIHGQLYDYGLKFNYQWAAPYWTYEWLIIGLLVCAVVINLLSISYLALSRKTRHQKQTLNKSIYQKLKNDAGERGIGVQELVRAVIIPEWLEENNK
jgi:phosphotransferase system  glucose/maltose/N-acetylglucosamine-specific IIC component